MKDLRLVLPFFVYMASGVFFMSLCVGYGRKRGETKLMKVIKKINNNVALCLDNNQHEVVAFGVGIGFPKVPYELHDLSKISRTFYCVDSSYISMLGEIDEGVIQVSVQIIDYAKQVLGGVFSSNVTFALADHINFAIERMKKGMEIKLPLYYDLAHLYQKEVAVGKEACKMIRKELRVYLPESEAYAIAMHLINARQAEEPETSVDSEKVISQVTHIIEQYYGIQIKKEDFNYSRFVSHMQYLLKRRDENVCISTHNRQLFEDVKRSFPEIHGCVEDIAKFFWDALHWKLNDEELLYLMLHINRLCSREDCNQ